MIIFIFFVKLLFLYCFTILVLILDFPALADQLNGPPVLQIF